MRNFLKQLVSFILPVTVIIFIPLSIEKDISVKAIPAFISGIIIICAGLTLMIIAISSFIRIGKGTLAPWSPTKKLVIAGIYRYVRNPMIIGVITVLFGESVAILSFNILLWVLIFFLINNVYFFIYEEPDLERKFGNDYREYKKNVPRWIPRLKPFSPSK